MRLVFLNLVLITTVLFAQKEKHYFMYTGDAADIVKGPHSYFVATGDGVVEMDTTFKVIKHHISFPELSYEHPPIYKLGVDKEGTIYADAPSYTYYFTGNSWQALKEEDTLITDIYHMYNLPSGALWFNRGGNLCQIKDGKWEFKKHPITGEKVPVDFILEDSKGRTIIIAENDSVVIRDDKLYTFPMGNKRIYKAGLDADDNLVMQRFSRSVGQGIPAPPYTAMHTYNWETEWIDSQFLGIQTYDIGSQFDTYIRTTRDGKELFVTRDSIIVLSNNQPIDTIRHEKHYISDLIHEGDNGTLYFRSYFPQNFHQYFGLIAYKDGQTSFIDTRTSNMTYQFSGMIFDRFNNPIIEGISAGDTLTHQVIDSTYYCIDSLLGIKSPFIHKLARDSQFNYHIIIESPMNNGGYSFINRTFTGEHHKPYPMSNNRALPTTIDSKGHLYAYRWDTLSTYGELVKYEKGVSTKIFADQSWELPNHEIDNILLQDDTLLWIEPTQYRYVFSINLHSGEIDSIEAAIPVGCENLYNAIMALSPANILYLSTSNNELIMLKDGKQIGVQPYADYIKGFSDIKIAPSGQVIICNRSNSFIYEDNEWYAAEQTGHSIPDFAIDAKGDLVEIYDDRTLITTPLRKEVAINSKLLHPNGNKLGLAYTDKSIRITNRGFTEGKISATIFSINGRKILQNSFVSISDGTYNISTCTLAKGVYILQVTSQGKSLLQQKFIKR